MPKIVDHDKYREELLYKCFDLIALRGYANITMREIAGELGVSTGSIYHYFPNKEGMMKNMLELILPKEIGKAYTYSLKGKTLGERVNRLLKYILDREAFFQNVILISLDYSRLGHGKDKRDFLNTMARLAQEKISEGGFDKERSFGVLMLNLISGILINRRMFAEEIDLDQQVNLSMSILKSYFD